MHRLRLRASTSEQSKVKPARGVPRSGFFFACWFVVPLLFFFIIILVLHYCFSLILLELVLVLLRSLKFHLQFIFFSYLMYFSGGLHTKGVGGGGRGADFNDGLQ